MSKRTEMLAKSAVRVVLTPGQQAAMRVKDSRPGVLRALLPPVSRLVRKPLPPAREGGRVIEPRLPKLDTPGPDTRGPR